MKSKFHVALCALLALALVAFGLGYGTRAGFMEERREVETLFLSENGIVTALSYRGADGLNLYAVASRYLPEDDPDMQGLKKAGEKLAFPTGEWTLDALFEADQELMRCVQAVKAALEKLPEFTANERDPKYLDMLLADMNSLASSATVTTFNRHASEFNAKLDTLLGRLAQWMGVMPIRLYQ